MTTTDWTLDKIPAPLGDRARELTQGATFTHAVYDDDPLAPPLEALFGEEMATGESDPRPQDAERYMIYAVMGGRYVTVELTWLGESESPTEKIEAVALTEIVGIKIEDEHASLEIGTNEDRYTTGVPKIIAEAILNERQPP
jgi:hypothetical protein